MNPGPLTCEASALPLSYIPHITYSRTYRVKFQVYSFFNDIETSNSFRLTHYKLSMCVHLLSLCGKKSTCFLPDDHMAVTRADTRYQTRVAEVRGDSFIYRFCFSLNQVLLVKRLVMMLPPMLLLLLLLRTTMMI